jgi:amidase
MSDEWWRLGAVEQAAAVRAGEVSAVALTEAHLERIAQVNPMVNAVTQVLAERALEDAKAVGREKPLAGVPVTVKESIAVAGAATTHGWSRLRDMVAVRDSPSVARLREAGAIIVGHTNMPTLTLAGMHTRSELFGETINPWDASRTPGGSSGGDGVTVATGMAAVGLGNDAGGSVRVPAVFNGVAALKPSHGRFAADHRIGADDPGWCSQTFVVDGPLARSVADLRAVFEVLAGADPRDPRAVAMPLDGPPAPGPVAVFADGVHPDVGAAIDAAAGSLRDAGYAVAAVAGLPRLGEALEAYQRMVMSEFAPAWPALSPLLGVEARRYIDFGMEAAPPVDIAEFLRLTGVRLSIRREWAAFLDRYPLILGPVFAEPPVEPGLESRDAEGHARVTRAMRLSTVTSFLGLPAVAVPTGLINGLPAGVQLIGRPHREDLCLAAAAAVEERLGTLTPIAPRS